MPTTGRPSDPSDFLNSGAQGANDPFNEFYSDNTLQQLTAIDLKQLDALGFHLTSNTPLVIQTDGSTSLVEVGNNYSVDNTGSGSGPELKQSGVAIAVHIADLLAHHSKTNMPDCLGIEGYKRIRTTQIRLIASKNGFH